jgi:hypothetical protein
MLIRLPCLVVLTALTLHTATATQAASRFAGRKFYFAVLGSEYKYPLFTKEYTDGPNIIRKGGHRQVWLSDQQAILGLRLGYDDIRYNRSGLGTSLSLWYSRFDDETIPYDRRPPLTLQATYKDPTHALVVWDINGLMLPWEGNHQAWGIYGLLSIVGAFERYSIVNFSTSDEQAGSFNTSQQQRSGLDVRFGLGLGTRFYLSKHLSIWAERRWIVGETFRTEAILVDGGFTEEGRQRTLYAPISSLGLAFSL